MSGRVKKWLCAAMILVIAGGMLFVVSFAALGFDLTKISTQQYEMNTYEMGEAFSNMCIDVSTADVTLVAAEDDACRVVCLEREREKHAVSVEDDMLVIRSVDERRWYEYIVGISFVSDTVMVYLPQATYASLQINTDVGNIDVKGAFSLGEANMQCDTGDITLDDVFCGTLNAQSNIGNILLRNVIVETDLALKTDTGDIKLDDCDASSIVIQTDIGDVEGTLLTDKIIFAQSDIGRVDVPNSTTGGNCEIKTDTGNIRIQIEEK